LFQFFQMFDKLVGGKRTIAARQQPFVVNNDDQDSDKVTVKFLTQNSIAEQCVLFPNSVDKIGQFLLRCKKPTSKKSASYENVSTRSTLIQDAALRKWRQRAHLSSSFVMTIRGFSSTVCDFLSLDCFFVSLKQHQITPMVYCNRQPDVIRFLDHHTHPMHIDMQN